MLNEQLGINNAKAVAGVADKESVESCAANGQQLDDLQPSEETENAQQISDDERPYISINDVVIADVDHNTELATRAMEDDITEEDIEIFKHNESVEAATISLSREGGGESLHVPRIHMQFESHEEAHAFYNNYALIVGFSTIKLDTYSSREKGASREVTRRMYKCNRRGNLDHQDNG